MKSQEEMQELFPETPEALENTGKIAQRCQVEFQFNDYHLPCFTAPEGFTSWEYLNKLCDDGLKEKYPAPYDEQKKQLTYELDIIWDSSTIF